jgi:hypothetical protein
LHVPLALAAALVALAGCSPEPAPAAQEETRAPAAAAKPEAKVPAAPGSGNEIAVAQASPRPQSAADAGERRCGWLTNPTPGNWWLFDGQGEWILATQGSEPAPGMDDMPDMSTAGWVETNGHYGYGCACMTIAFDPATRRVTRVSNFRPQPLKQCRRDRALPRP